MIKRLALHNFKSIVDVTIDFQPLTVLIGRSGTGKTNIVDGLRFWRDFLRDGTWNRQPAQWPSVLSANAPQKVFGFEVDFTIPGTPGEFRYRVFFDSSQLPHAPPLLRVESLEHAGKLLFKQDGKLWVTPPDVMQVPGPGQPALGSTYGLPEVKLAYVALTQGIGCYDFPSNVLAPIDGQAPQQISGLTDHAENYLRVYETVGHALGSGQSSEIVAALRQLNPTIATLDLETRQRNRIFVGQRTASGKALTLELSQQSEGFRRFLAHLLALYQIPSKPTLIFEEAEKGIYPGALSALADHFKAVAERGTSQVILTTHSPEMLDQFPVESIRVVEMEDYQTKVGPVASEQVEAVRRDLLSAGELLTADPARVAEQV